MSILKKHYLLEKLQKIITKKTKFLSLNSKALISIYATYTIMIIFHLSFY